MKHIFILLVAPIALVSCSDKNEEDDKYIFIEAYYKAIESPNYEQIDIGANAIPKFYWKVMSWLRQRWKKERYLLPGGFNGC